MTKPSSIRSPKFKMGWKVSIVVLLVATLFLLLSLTTQSFCSASNIYSMLYGVSIQFFVLIGFTYLMIQGEIDMSVGSMYGFGGALLGYLLHIKRLSFLPALLITLAIAATIGLLIGLVTTKFRVNSMMVTLGALMALQGVNWIMINVYSSKSFGRAASALIKFKIGGISWTVIAMFGVVAVLEVLLHTNSVFKKMFIMGQNRFTAAIYGIKVDRMKLITFGVSALTAAFGGVLATCRLGNADVTTGEGLEFTMVTAAVLGGASLFGGKGSILYSVVGLFFLVMLQNGMTAYSIKPFTQKIVMGAILILAVLLDMGLNRKKS